MLLYCSLYVVAMTSVSTVGVAVIVPVSSIAEMCHFRMSGR